MRKNTASQVVTAQLNSATDGSAVTSGTTTVYVLGDGGTQASGGGTVTHEGQGCWSYVPTQAETNYDHVAYTFTNSSAISQTVQAWPILWDNSRPSVDTDSWVGTTLTAATAGGYPQVDVALVLATPAEASSGRFEVILGNVAHGGASSTLTLSSATVSGNLTAGNVAAEFVGNMTGSVGSVTGGLNTTGGTITTLDGLDTAQDTQHSTTQSAITALQADLPTTPTKGVQLANFPFLMVDSTDFNTPETGLTVSGTISKDGGSFSALTNSVTEVANGIYKVTITATEMNADTIVLRFTATGAADRLVSLLTAPT